MRNTETNGTAYTRPGGSGPNGGAGAHARPLAILAWSACATVLLLLTLSVLLAYLGRSDEVPGWASWQSTAILCAGLAGATVLGALIASRRPGDFYGWAWLGFGTGLALTTFGGTYATYAVMAGPRSLPFPRTVATVLTEGFVVSIVLLPFLFLLFPDGRLPSWRWRVLAWPVITVGAVVLILGPFGPGGSGVAPIRNPFKVQGAAGEAIRVLVDAGVVAIFAAAALSSLSLVSRYRRARGVERQQIKWMAYAAASLGTILVIDGVLNVQPPGLWNPLLESLPFFGLYAAVGMAILRHRLWDIDLLINRTLVYGALTACVIAVYVAIVGYLGASFQARGNLLVSLFATGVIAVLFAPLKDRLQRGVNRLMYGERDDPYVALSRLGRRLEGALAPEAALEVVAESVAQALRLPYADIELEQNGESRRIAESGTPRGETVSLPLRHKGEAVGRLIVAPRSPGEGFSSQDMRLLEDLARQAGAAAHAALLAADLRRSRERLVVAGEEERRRLRRDLHDGLGPTLGGLTLGFDAARGSFVDDPGGADTLLADLGEQIQKATSDVRHLVHGLRPPALDDLGLVSAIRQQAANRGALAADSGEATNPEGRLTFAVRAPDYLPPLSAAVEVACYLIAQEAMTNAARHAGAHTCHVFLSLNRANAALELEVADDGVGMPEGRVAGVGISSMRERAEEIGGTLSIRSRPGSGTRVLARLPLPEKEAQ